MIHVATIVAAHGIKGEVKVKSYTAEPKGFAFYGPLSAPDGRKFEIKTVRPQKDDFLCTLNNITDRNAAEALRGTELFVAREKLPALKDAEFYLSDAQGKQAVVQGKDLGRVIGFQNFGAGELMELDNGMLIPIFYIATIDDTVTLNLPEGYLEAE